MSRRVPIMAVDGGNSKTDVALVRRDGTVIGTARGPGSSHQGMGMDGSLRVLAATIERACRDAGVDPGRRPLADLGVYCMAGADLPVDDRRLAHAFATRGWAARDVVRNDTFAVMRAGTNRRWGVAVVCGAGMNCVGVGPDGKHVRFPALGLISGDWGGGYWVGMAALAAAVRGRDGRGPRSLLERTVPEHFGLRTPTALVEALYVGTVREGRVVELPPLVFDAARQGDRAARDIIDRLGDEVVAMAGAAIRRLRLTRTDVEVILGGGLFRNDDHALIERIRKGIAVVAPAARVERLHSPPIVGAALIGLDSMGGSNGADSRLRRALAGEATPPPAGGAVGARPHGPRRGGAG